MTTRTEKALNKITKTKIIDSNLMEVLSNSGLILAMDITDLRTNLWLLWDELKAYE